MNAVRPDDMTDEEWDSARRMSDAVNLHVGVMRVQMRDRPGYVGIRLEDGRSPDGTLYDNIRDLLRHNPNDQYLFPCRVGKMEMSPSEAVIVLKIARQGKASGMVFHHEVPVIPMLPELLRGSGGMIDLSNWSPLKGTPE